MKRIQSNIIRLHCNITSFLLNVYEVLRSQ